MTSTRSRRLPRLFACALGGCAVALTGCTLTVTPARPSASADAPAAPVRADAWPERWTAGLPQFADVECAYGYMKAQTDQLATERDTDLYRLLVLQQPGGVSLKMPAFARVIGPAWVRWFEHQPMPQEDRPNSVSDIFEVRTWRADRPSTAPLADDPTTPEWFISREALAKTATFTQSFQLVWPERPPRGLAVVMWPLSGSRHVNTVLANLLADGWVILSQRTLTFETRDMFGAMMSDEAWLDRNVSINLAGRGAEVGVQTDQLLADQAYVVDAAVTHVSERYPELASMPKVLIGFSLGALTAPTVAARLGPRVDGLVLVGGGAQIGPVLATSGVLKNRAGGPFITLPEFDRPVFELDYLGSSRLDAYHVAPTLRSLAILQIDADDDGIIRPRYADQLWKRLGRPERWTLSSGHAGLFLTMDAMAGDIANWVNARVLCRVSAGRSADYHPPLRSPSEPARTPPTPAAQDGLAGHEP